MGFLSENVIPGNYGKIFGTDASEPHELQQVKEVIMGIDGIKDCIINDEVFPVEFTVHTRKVVKVDDIENRVKAMGFHVIPKSMFEL